MCPINPRSPTDSTSSIDPTEVGEQIYSLIVRLFPICRSITGNGLRETLRILQEFIPLQIHEVPSGTQVFDWTVPKEWNITDAWVKDPQGRKIIDFKQSNLHVVNYSAPIRAKMSLAELKPHLFTLPEHPDWIPYRTSYYKETWGFCLSHRSFVALEEGEYEVCIDSTLKDGHLTYGECRVPGETADEILISTHVCHPSLANDNLSGVATAAVLARFLDGRSARHSCRFLFIPGTIGAITWLQRNFESVFRVKHGLVLSGIGDPGGITYKKSRRGNAEIDRVAEYVLKQHAADARLQEFSPYGYDERQYCSPGFNLPVGRLSRSPYGEYPEYHTSADDLSFVRRESLVDSFSVLVEILDLLEGNAFYTNQLPFCEPQLGKRGLYDQIGANQLAMLWVLNLSDSRHSLLDIAQKSGIDFSSIREAAVALQNFNLLK
jgi:aminopeptidase-like protein